ncbi:MAG TPA: YbaY family lipoprotein [Chloroflexaceae bacterium]|nr:YbaY family lipoprotein [Chloroflexaceae bacterium]
MKVARALALLATLVLLAVPALASAQQTPAAVSGTLSTRDRAAIPANAVVTVQIAQVATAGQPGQVIAEQRFTTNGAQPPYRYSITYDPGRVDAARQYTAQANITVNGQPRYSTNTIYRVITGGAPVTNVNMNLVGTTRLPPTSAGTLPLLVAGTALLAAVGVFAFRRYARRASA